MLVVDEVGNLTPATPRANAFIASSNSETRAVVAMVVITNEHSNRWGDVLLETTSSTPSSTVSAPL